MRRRTAKGQHANRKKPERAVDAKVTRLYDEVAARVRRHYDELAAKVASEIVPSDADRLKAKWREWQLVIERTFQALPSLEELEQRNRAEIASEQNGANGGPDAQLRQQVPPRGPSEAAIRGRAGPSGQDFNARLLKTRSKGPKLLALDERARAKAREEIDQKKAKWLAGVLELPTEEERIAALRKPPVFNEERIAARWWNRLHRKLGGRRSKYDAELDQAVQEFLSAAGSENGACRMTFDKCPKLKARYKTKGGLRQAYLRSKRNRPVSIVI